ncbi:MAG: triose-phosphate isomerase [SAR324 cluster bacterium]|nr:triose-phosphate isomerase [SAR324 cluster bacterium]
MNGSAAMAEALVSALISGVPEELFARGGGMAVCPPFPYLAQTRALLAESPVALGAQNVYPADSGPFTGEVSTAMLAGLGVTLCLVGHSERRHVMGESDVFVREKLEALLQADIRPILCVGETLAQRDGGVAERTVLSQLEVVLERAGAAAFADAVVAYEPVWAIGTGRTATPEDAQAMHAAIRGRVAETDETIAEGLRILYGGSVNAANASTLFAQPDVDGGLVGGASLDPEQFAHIYEAAQA